MKKGTCDIYDALARRIVRKAGRVLGDVFVSLGRDRTDDRRNEATLKFSNK